MGIRYTVSHDGITYIYLKSEQLLSISVKVTYKTIIWKPYTRPVCVCTAATNYNTHNDDVQGYLSIKASSVRPGSEVIIIGTYEDEYPKTSKTMFN